MFATLQLVDTDRPRAVISNVRAYGALTLVEPIARSGHLSAVGARSGSLQLVLGGSSMLDLIGPILLYRGDDATMRLTVTDDDDDRIALTLAAIEFVIKTGVGVEEATISKSIGSGITLLDQDAPATKGQADIVLASSDTADVAPGLYYLDVVVTINSVRTHVIAAREFTIADVVSAP